MIPRNFECGRDKCKKMHIGNSYDEITCTDLYENGWKEESVKTVETGTLKIKDTYEGEQVLDSAQGEKYLGDIVSSDGKNYKNILSRKNRGTVIITELNSMLTEMMLGRQNFKIGVLLRSAMLVSSLLFNCEAWYGITKKEVNLLESVDENFMRKMLD